MQHVDAQQAGRLLAESYQGEPWFVEVTSGDENGCVCLFFYVTDKGRGIRLPYTYYGYPVLVRRAKQAQSQPAGATA